VAVWQCNGAEQYLTHGKSPEHQKNTMRKLSRQVKDDILSLLLQGLSTREIANRVGVGRTSVIRIRRQTPVDLPTRKAGRPKALSTLETQRVVRAVQSGRCKNAAVAQKRLFPDTAAAPSLSTIRRSLHDASLKHYRKRKKPRLAKRHIHDRLTFAQQHEGWTVNDWKRVVWSDEAKMQMHNSDGVVWCWRMAGEAHDPRNVTETVKYGGGRIMVWGCMTADGVGIPCRIDRNMNAKLYTEILGDELLQSLETRHKVSREPGNRSYGVAHPIARLEPHRTPLVVHQKMFE